MSDNPEISASVDLDLSQYQRNLRQAIKQADEFDDALDSLVQEANAAEKAINKLSGDVKLDIDANFSSLLDADRALQALDTTISPLVDVSVVNEKAAKALLDDFNATLTAKLDVETSELEQAQALLDKLDSASPAIPFDVDDSEIDTTKRKVEDLDAETIDTKVNADDSELADIKSQLETLRKLAVIDIILNLPENLPGVDDIPLLGAIQDQDKAKRLISAGTGGNDALVSQYAAGAEDVFASNFGEDRQDAARGYMEVVRQTKDETGELATTGENFGKITKDAFATAAQTGEDFTSVLAAADTLVQTKLAPDYSSAFDMINNGFQEGLNKGNDFLDTIKEYSGQFADLGFSANEFFSTLKGGLEAGAFNTDFIADLVKEMNIRAQAAATKGSAEFDYFKAIGMRDEVKAFNAGEMTGKEFFSGIIQAAASGEFDPQEIFDVLGTKAEDLTLEAVLKLDPAQVDEEIAKYNGTTIEVAAQLGGDLDSSIQTARRKIESELATSVSNAFDIPGKIQQFSDGVSKMSDLIDMGASIPEAIEVAFQLPGFAEGVDILASGMGNLGISFMQLVASVLDALGKGDAAGSVRGTIAQAAEAQLAFDLKLADDGSDFSNAIKAATERGVSDADIQSAIATSGGELLAAGDMTGAQTFLTALQDMATIELSPELTKFLTGQGIDTTNLTAVKEAAQALADNPSGMGVMNQFASLAEFQTALDDAKGLLGEVDFATTAQEALTPFKQQFTEAEEAATKSMENMRLKAEANLPGMAQIATSAVPPVNEQFLGLQNQFTETDIAFTTLGTNVTTTTGTIGTTLSTATSNIDAFAGNAETQFGEVTVGALDSADIKMQAFGETVLNTMLQASADVQGLIDKLLSIGGLDINLPPVGGGGGTGDGPGFAIGPAPQSGGQQIIPGQAVGGTIEAGTLGKVHAEETLYAGAHNVSVLNRQTSSVIDSAIAAVMAGAGMGGGGSTTNYYVTNNVVVNTQGAAATSAAMDSKAVRGY